MIRDFLLDENTPKWLRRVLSIRCPGIGFTWVGDHRAPARGTQDPEILHWCEKNDCYLLTNNRNSMPLHLKVHCDSGGHIPGIFKIRPRSNIHVLASDLELVAFASWANEYQDRIVELPL
jgi:hypothetical protein